MALSPQKKSSGVLFLGGWSVATTIVAVGALFFLRTTPRNGMASELNDPFDKWGKPDFVIVLSGQTHGYLQPCGCSKPQFGGYARRFRFVESLRKRGWVVLPVDLGDLAPSPAPQAMLKYATAMKALDLMKYTAVTLGKREFDMPLVDALSHYSLQRRTPVLIAANLLNRGKDQTLEPFGIRPYVIATGKNLPRIGIVGFIGQSVVDEIKKIKDPDVAFAPGSTKVLDDTLTEIKKRNAEFNILLYQGSEKSNAEVKALTQYCHSKHPKTPVFAILRLDQTSEPAAMPLKIGKTMVVAVGHKGRFVGVIGVYRKGASFDLKYELVSIGPKYDSPEGKEKSNPVIALMEDYARKVKAGNYITKFPRNNHWLQDELSKEKVHFVGTRTCAGCHSHAHKVWKNSGHSHAWKTLTEAKQPSLRQFDGECVVCHAVGFKYRTGYLDPKNSASKNKRLLNVGCESCHGPGSFHANNPFKSEYYSLINPWRMSDEERNPKTEADRKAQLKKQRMSSVDRFCMKCHDLENDVNWVKVPFEKKWNPIAHPTPQKEKIGVQAPNGN